MIAEGTVSTVLPLTATTTRTNLTPRPYPAVAGGWSATSGTSFGPVTIDTAVVRRPGSASARCDRTGSLIDGTVGSWSYVGAVSTTARPGLTGGQPHTISVYGLTGKAFRMRIQATWYDAGGAVTGSVFTGATQAGGVAGLWFRYAVTVTPPAAAASAQIRVDVLTVSGNIVGGEQSWIQDCLIEAGSTVGDYFDGAQPDTPTTDYAWTGTAHASPSTATTTAIDLGRVEGDVGSDESWSPFVRAGVTIAMPDRATLDQIDPRQRRRVKIDAAMVYPFTDPDPRRRTFDLGIRARTVDHAAGEVAIELASDEALLMDDVLLQATPLDLTGHRDSLRGLVDAVLARIGAHLEPGTKDASFQVLDDATNLLPNPSAETNVANWIRSTANSSISRAQTPNPTAYVGSWSFSITASAATSAMGLFAGTATTAPLAIPVTAGKPYTFTYRVRTAVASRTAQAKIRWSSASAIIGSDSAGVSVAISTTGWTTVTVTATAPAGATNAAAFADTAGSWTTGQVVYFDGLVFVENKTAPGVDYGAYFDGDTPDTADANYAWTSTPHGSTSTRDALDPSDPDALVWQPAVSAWEFLQPLFQRAGARLFCDEIRRWFLVDGATYIAEGVLQLSVPGLLHSAGDVIDRDGDWFDAAIARYRWTDDTGAVQERVDFYGKEGYSRVRTFEIQAAYPGPGFARYSVSRADGLGRTVDLVALANLDAHPTMPLSVILPASPTLVGVVRSVAFDLNEGTMRVTSRGLTDAPVGSWILVNPTLVWTAVPPTLTWTQALFTSRIFEERP